LLPVFIIISVLILIFMGWPIIFKQPRPGKNEKIFNVYKFRTMSNKKDKKGKLLPDEERLNKLGRILRKSSLDELPELFNILKGDMSFVGPRPLLAEYIPYYTKKEHHRHDVRPGLTGWAQVNGRNSLKWDDRFKKDLEYVKKMSFPFDVRIILLTVKKVFLKEDIQMGKDLKFGRLDVERRK
jgi:lipopolysaccharide/colanic/teichoic acid biosynthesis glycosyltransferase